MMRSLENVSTFASWLDDNDARFAIEDYIDRVVATRIKKILEKHNISTK
jgi:hypothetical protein